MDVRDYLRIVRRRWLLILSCTLLGAAAATLITLRATPMYASTARLFVSTPTDATSQAYQGGLFSQQRVLSYADLIKGDRVAQLVIDRFKLTESATELAGQVGSKVVPSTVILEVTVTDPSPNRAQQLAQAFADEFTKFIGKLETAPGKSVAPIKATIVGAAGLPAGAVSPRPVTNIGLGVILGLLVGLGAAGLREVLDTTITTPETLQEATGTVLVGSLNFDSSASKLPLVTELDTHSPRLEAFRMLRTNLQFLDVEHSSKTFVITSPLAGEGKSTTAINIAITLAQAGQRTILLEGDLRRPKVNDYLRLEPTVGLTTVLIGRVNLEDAIQPWGSSGLDVITSGATPPNPAELLQSKPMAGVLAELRARYDVIIVDSPPLLPVTDASVLAAQADGAILVVRYGKTTKEQAAQARQRLQSVDAKLLGTVFNFVPARAAHTYGYGYGYAPEFTFHAAAGKDSWGAGAATPPVESNSGLARPLRAPVSAPYQN